MKKTDVWKKAAAAGLAGLLAVGTITGCSAKTDTKEAEVPAGNTAQKDGAAAKDTAAGTADGDIPTLVYWTVGGTTPSDFDQDMEAINEYLAEKIHVKLDLKVAGWGDYEKKMNTCLLYTSPSPRDA